MPECSFQFLLWEWQLESVRLGFSAPFPQRSFSLWGIILAGELHLLRRTCAIRVYTGDWIEHKKAISRRTQQRVKSSEAPQNEILENEIGELTTTRPIAIDSKASSIFDRNDAEFVIRIWLNKESCEAALSMCHDILTNGYHVAVTIETAGSGLKVQPREFEFIGPGNLDFSQEFKAAITGVEFARTALPLKIRDRPPITPQIDSEWRRITVSARIDELQLMSEPPPGRIRRMFVKGTARSDDYNDLDELAVVVNFAEYEHDLETKRYPDQCFAGTFSVIRKSFGSTLVTPDFYVTLYYRKQDLDAILKLFLLPTNNDIAVITLSLLMGPSDAQDESERTEGQVEKWEIGVAHSYRVSSKPA